jgi:hypothetical protein
VDVRLQIWICYDSKQLPKMKNKPFSQTLETPGRDSLFINTLRPSPVVARNPQTCHLVAVTVYKYRESKSHPHRFFPCSSSPLYRILIGLHNGCRKFPRFQVSLCCHTFSLPPPPSHLQASPRQGALRDGSSGSGHSFTYQSTIIYNVGMYGTAFFPCQGEATSGCL